MKETSEMTKDHLENYAKMNIVVINDTEQRG